MTDDAQAPAPAPDPVNTADTNYANTLQAIITAGTVKSAPLRAQAMALLQQANALDGPDVQAARQRLQMHKRMHGRNQS